MMRYFVSQGGTLAFSTFYELYELAKRVVKLLHKK